MVHFFHTMPRDKIKEKSEWFFNRSFTVNELFMKYYTVMPHLTMDKSLGHCWFIIGWTYKVVVCHHYQISIVHNYMCCTFVWLAAQQACLYQHHHKCRKNILYCTAVTTTSARDKNCSASWKYFGTTVVYAVCCWRMHCHMTHDCTMF